MAEIEYAFNVEKVNPLFAKLPVEVQASIETHIVEVIFDSFIEPADHDYLAARSLAIGGLYRPFFWSASQAIEKYIKAFLILNDISVKGINHNLTKLLDEAGKIERDFGVIDLTPHPNIIFPEGDVGVTKFSVASFIDELTRLGSAANRYNDVGAIYNTGHLFALDALVYNLRNKMDNSELRASFRGRLSKDFLRYLYDNNPYFAPKEFAHTELPSSVFPLVVSMASTRWSYLKTQHNHPHLGMAREWLQEKMLIR